MILVGTTAPAHTRAIDAGGDLNIFRLCLFNQDMASIRSRTGRRKEWADVCNKSFDNQSVIILYDELFCGRVKGTRFS